MKTIDEDALNYAICYIGEKLSHYYGISYDDKLDIMQSCALAVCRKFGGYDASRGASRRSYAAIIATSELNKCLGRLLGAMEETCESYDLMIDRHVADTSVDLKEALKEYADEDSDEYQVGLGRLDGYTCQEHARRLGMMEHRYFAARHRLYAALRGVDPGDVVCHEGRWHVKGFTDKDGKPDEFFSKRTETRYKKENNTL